MHETCKVSKTCLFRIMQNENTQVIAIIFSVKGQTWVTSSNKYVVISLIISVQSKITKNC